jgi:hypothetical protein
MRSRDSDRAGARARPSSRKRLQIWRRLLPARAPAALPFLANGNWSNFQSRLVAGFRRHSWGGRMKIPRRKFLHLAAGAAALPGVSRIARAQAYPSRPITAIVPLAPHIAEVRVMAWHHFSCAVRVLTMPFTQTVG